MLTQRLKDIFYDKIILAIKRLLIVIWIIAGVIWLILEIGTEIKLHEHSSQRLGQQSITPVKCSNFFRITKPLRWKKFTYKNHDLNQSTVITIEQDSIGNLFIGTQWGMMYYTGEKFVDIKNDSIHKEFITKILSLPDNRLAVMKRLNKLYLLNPYYPYSKTKMQLDTQIKFYNVLDFTVFHDTIFILNSKEILKFDLKTHKRKTLLYLPDTLAHQIVVKPNKLLLAKAYSLVLYSNTGKRIKTFRYKPVCLKSYDQEFWFCTKNKIFRLKNDTIPQQILRIDSANITNLALWHNFLFIGTEKKGLFIYDTIQKRIVNYTQKNGLSNDNIHAILIDKDNNLWVGTDDGLNKAYLCGKEFYTKTLGTVWSITKIPNKGYLIGSSKEIYFLSELYSKPKVLKKNVRVTAIEFVPDNTIYYSDVNRVFKARLSPQKKLTNEKLITPKDLRKVRFIKKIGNQLYIGSDAGLFIYSDQELKSLYPNNYFYAFDKDSDTIIICDYYGNLRIITPNDTIRYPVKAQEVSYIKKVGNKLWIGQKKNGLIVFDLTHKRIDTVFNQENQSLPNDLIYAITFYRPDSSLWISTNNGLVQLKLKNDSTYWFDENDGLLDDEFNSEAVFNDNDSLLIFGSVNGITYFNPKDIKIDTTVQYPVMLYGLKLYKNHYLYEVYNAIIATDTIILPYGRNGMEFRVATLDFIAPQKIIYKIVKYQQFNPFYGYSSLFFGKSRYQINSNYYINTKLPPGIHVFKIYSTNHEGRNAKLILQRQLVVKVLPLWWQRWWVIFLGLSLLFSAIFITIFIQKRIQKHKQIALEARRQQFEVIAQEIDLPIAICNENRTIIWCNERFQNMINQDCYDKDILEFSQNKEILREKFKLLIDQKKTKDSYIGYNHKKELVETHLVYAGYGFNKRVVIIDVPLTQYFDLGRNFRHNTINSILAILEVIYGAEVRREIETIFKQILLSSMPLEDLIINPQSLYKVNLIRYTRQSPPLNRYKQLIQKGVIELNSFGLLENFPFSQSLSLVISMIINNALLHSNVQHMPIVKIAIDEDSQFFYIKISNKSSSADAIKLKKIIEQIHDKNYEPREHLGLYYIFKITQDQKLIHDFFSVDVNIDTDSQDNIITFIIKIQKTDEL